MAKLTDLRIVVLQDDEKIAFTTPVNVTKEGLFTTTLPPEARQAIAEYGLDLPKGRTGTPGYFSAKQLDELERTIRATVLDALSRECVEDRLVIKYEIQTAGSYVKDEDGELLPNGYYVKDHKAFEEGRATWQDGTITGFSMHGVTPCLTVWAKVYHKRRYVYKSGKEKTEMTLYEGKDRKSSLDWLNSTVHDIPAALNATLMTSELKRRALEHLPEIEATEKNAAFFVTMYKLIFKANDLFKQFTDPKTLQAFLETNNINQLSF